MGSWSRPTEGSQPPQADLGAGAVLFLRTDLAPVAGVGLVCVGAGWCLTYIPGTAILADATNPMERGTLFGRTPSPEG